MFTCFFFGKGELVMTFNRNWSEPLDRFFMMYTYLGLGLTMFILSLLFAFVRYYHALLMGASLLGVGIISLICKKLLFASAPRPLTVIGAENFHHLIPDLDIHQWNSFPSGHTMTAFCMATALAIYSRHNGMGYILFLLAALVGISRIYLLQHFFIDVYVGALTGIALPIGLHLKIKKYRKQLSGNLILQYFPPKKRLIRAWAKQNITTTQSPG